MMCNQPEHRAAGGGFRGHLRVFPVVTSGPYPAANLAAAREELATAGLVMEPSPLAEHAAYDPGTPPGPFDYLALDDASRAATVKDALLDPRPGILWAMRGGFGAARLLPLLNDLPAPLPRVKPLVGFSDLTALHTFRQSRGLGPGIHGPNLNQFAAKSRDVKHAVYSLCYGDMLNMPLNLGPRLCALRPGRASGVLTGGNLAVLASLLGTGFLPDYRGGILFLEDVNEHPYALDRMLTSLALAGVFSAVSAVIMGQFTPPEGVDADALERFVQRRTLDLLPETTPVLAGLSCGHGSENFPIPLGVRAEVDADAGAVVPREPWIERG